MEQTAKVIDNAEERAACDQWLCHVLGVSTPPVYEQNALTVSILSQVRRYCSESQQRAVQLCADLRRRRAELSSDRQRLTRLQAQLGVSNEHLLPATQKTLRAVARVVVKSGATVAGEEAVTCQIAGLREQHELTDDSERDSRHTIDRLTGEIPRLMADLEAARARAKQLHNEKEQRASESAGSSFLKDKVRQYEKQLCRVSRSLRERGVDQSLSHETVAQQAGAVRQLDTELQQVNEQLKMYSQLPTCPQLAAVKLTELEMQLELLEQQLNEKTSSALR